MSLSRRPFLSTVAAGAAASVLVEPVAAEAASSPGDVVGKITAGYQGWFACPGDGAPIGGWWHWSRDRFQPPSPANTALVSWPDMRDLDHGYATAYANLGNGQPAQLVSSYDQQTVDTHFRWMQTYGIDTAALQRFNPFGDEGPTRNAMTAKVRSAAEAYGRKFYVMYDVTGGTNAPTELKADWTSTSSAHTASPAYARQNGKPVVCLWGFGFDDNGRPFTAAQALDVITRFKAQGVYVIGGVPTWWRQGINDSRAGSGIRPLDEDGTAFVAANAVDGNAPTYWESANNAFPQWVQVDLGAATSIGRVVLRLPASWGARTQTLSVNGSTDGAFTTLAAGAARTLDPPPAIRWRCRSPRDPCGTPGSR